MSTILKLHQRYKWVPINLSIVNKRYQQTRPQTKRLPKYQPFDIVPVFRRASNFTDKVALRDSVGCYTYGNLFMGAKELSNELTHTVSEGNTLNQKVLFLCNNDANYVLTQWAIWMSGHIAVPLSPLHPQNLLEYYATNSNSKLIITTAEYSDLIQRVAKNSKTKVLVLDDKLRQNTTQKNPTKKSDMEGGLPSDFYNKSNAMILYTSGTTGQPKGVLLSHKNIISQITCLIDAWKWTEKDMLLHTLPLHHVHGIVNALLCPQYIGAKCIMLPQFDANTVWAYLLGINTNPDDRKINIYMAVPTIYLKLINEYQKVFSGDAKMVEYIRTTLKNKLRLMVSGSAPLSTSIHNKWFEISGHKLLERYGMTEIGMCLSNLYDSDRDPGYVGLPLPGVSVRLTRKIDDGEDSSLSLLESKNIKGKIETNITGWNENDDPVGELQVKGDNVFKEYYNNPQATHQEFTIDGWFKTGDISQYSLKDKKFKLLGRQSVDIIKSGGYKISALAIENHMSEHPSIAECIVIGVKDEELGQKIVALVVLKPQIKEFHVEEFKEWAKTRMPVYWIPKDLIILTSLPKNAMGKVNKQELIQNMFT